MRSPRCCSRARCSCSASPSPCRRSSAAHAAPSCGPREHEHAHAPGEGGEGDPRGSPSRRLAPSVRHGGEETDVSIGLATAPVSWGVWERTIERPDLIPPDTFLETIADIGYPATETGPPGYFAPTGAAAVELARRYGVELIATFLPL